MNQFFLDPELFEDRMAPVAEPISRVALFSRLAVPGQGATLQKRRAKIASSVRTKRRRGVVPVMIGLMWFLFVLALSIRSSKSLHCS